MPSNAIDFVLGEWVMRRGDRLPMLGLTLETDTAEPLDITGAVCTLMLRHEDGGLALDPDQPIIARTAENWLLLPAFVYDGPHGVVLYDWPQAETESLRIGVHQMMVRVEWPGRHASVPTARDARLIVRDSAL